MNEKQTELMGKSQTILTAADRIKIRTDEAYEKVGAFLVNNKTFLKTVKDFFEPMRFQTYKAYQEVLKATKLATAPIEQAEKIVKKKMNEYTSQKEKERREEEERLRKIAIAEEEERRLKEVEETGDESILDEPVVVPETKVEMPKPKAEGVSIRKVVRFRVTDGRKLPRRLLMPNLLAIKQLVSVNGMDTNIPGLEVYEESIVAARSIR